MVCFRAGVFHPPNHRDHSMKFLKKSPRRKSAQRLRQHIWTVLTHVILTFCRYKCYESNKTVPIWHDHFKTTIMTSNFWTSLIARNKKLIPNLTQPFQDLSGPLSEPRHGWRPLWPSTTLVTATCLVPRLPAGYPPWELTDLPFESMIFLLNHGILV